MIPGCALDFQYGTHINADRYTASLRANPEYRLAHDGFGTWSMGANFEVNAAQVDAWGTDRLSLSGYASNFKDISKDKLGFGYAADLYIGWKGRDRFGARLSIGYRDEPGSPVNDRNGNFPSQLGFKNQGALVIGGSLIAHF